MLEHRSCSGQTDAKIHWMLAVKRTLYQAEENEDVTIRWDSHTKTDMSRTILVCFLQSKPLKVLYEMINGVEVPESQHQQFAGRVQCDEDAMREGRVRLHLSRVRTDDSGNYWCDLAANYDELLRRWVLKTTEHFVLNVTSHDVILTTPESAEGETRSPGEPVKVKKVRSDHWDKVKTALGALNVGVLIVIGLIVVVDAAVRGGPAGRKIVRCLLDGGSQRSFIHEDVAKALGLPVIRQETLNLHTFGSTTPATVQRNIVKVWMENVWDSQQRIEIEAVETPQVCSAVIKVPCKPLQEEVERKGLQLADFSLDGSDDPELSVLIGGDFYWQVVSGKVQRLTKSLVAIESSFGWTLQGPVSTSSVTDATCMHISLEEDIQIAKQLHAFWEVESLGIVHEKSKSPEETEALQNFEQTVTHNNGRYQVELPWRPDKPDLPDNFRVAKGRFEGLKRRLKTDTTLYKGYSDVIKDYLQQGICEDVPANTLQEENPESVKYYMPHHAVLREDKITTKLRVVFDASSHEDGSPSLNDCLLTGPNLNPNLLDVLIKFRLHQIAFTADITKAFLQIALAEKDNDAVRFLWLQGPPTKDCENDLRILRMSRVVFGVSPSPFLLAATIRKHIKQYETEQPKTVEALRECLYVDDFITSSSDVDEALSVTTKAKEILSHAGMNLCKWITNSPELRAKWTERGMEHTTETATCGNVLKVLGLVWRSEKDDFVYDLKGLLDIMKGKENTKRNVLQTSARIFDPIGFLTPFTIRAKCLFQELWERGVGWDDQLPSDLAEKWDRWCAELPQLHQLDIPRWYQIDIKPDSQTVKLHVFCDASERAYSAVAYLQGENKEKEIVTSFVASKSKGEDDLQYPAAHHADLLCLWLVYTFTLFSTKTKD
ncbi:hypothetical protein L3Q82_003921 [Scortum barcoo]|uniref:Uncharacterized protein n=1 Tax=Scortum barcoo TaxID=214431 RepID=A0ACB8X6K3_9TELE|nr:hypothetical protein L3Q82_003921 [Scortum barcoo]